jgi:hypothetical protein
MKAAAPPDDLEWSESVAGRESSVVFRPPKLQSIPILVGASLWDSFVLMLWIALSRAHPERPEVVPVGHAVLAAQAIIGAVVTWIAIARTLNQLRIRLDASAFVVEESPVPGRALRIATGDLERFEAYRAAGASDARAVRAVKRGGGAVRLALHLDGEEAAAYVASRLNAALAVARGTPSA